jgi:hypothetical protein
MSALGPALAARLEPQKTDERGSQERHERKRPELRAGNKVPEPREAEEISAEAAAAEPGAHQLDERA